MGLPAFAFDGARYVSDALELLLDAGDARRAVRAFAMHLLDAAPPKLRAQLEPVAAYVGGKCMGYPAVWFLQQLLDDENCDARAIVERCRGTLCMSLSTSIVDDLEDRDEDAGSECLGFLYVLLGEPAFAQCASPNAMRYLYRAIDACLNPGSQPDSLAARGDRIGAFYAMIAADALRDVWSAEQTAVGVEATRAFGDICAHLDDWMDVERDLAQGTKENVALTLLRDRLGGTILSASVLQHYRELLDELMAALLAASIDKTIALLETPRASRAVKAMTRLAETLRRTEAGARESACRRVAGA